ncbi:hypothetical protein FRC07_014891 [Ceratobasidium sp. 392]|nr:hypothetical protein FRC07_014891 [Ceratobasidium sp. 392]
MGFKNRLVIAAAAAAGVSAQGWMQGGSSLSSSCQTALADVYTGPAGECLGVSGLAGIAMTQGNDSLITPIDSWLSTTCAQPACTNGTIDALIANVTSGCRTDLDRWDVSDDQMQTVEEYIKKYYFVAREIACLKDTNSSNQFCITETLKSWEAQIGVPLTPNNLQSLSYSHDISQNATLIKNLTCTDCTKAAWSIIKPYVKSDDQASVESQIDEICGSGFANSSAPPSIQRTANTAIQASNNNSQNGATTTSVFGSMMAIALGAVGVFALVL